MKKWLQLDLIFLFIITFYSCQQKKISTTSWSRADSLEVAQLKAESNPYYQSNQDSFALLQLQMAAIYRTANNLDHWLSCYDTIIKAYRLHDQEEKSLLYYEQLYKNIWREPADSLSMVTLAETNRQIGRIYYVVRSDYIKAIPFYDEAIRLITKAHGWNPELALIIYKSAGNCCARLDDYQNAIIYHQRNVQICRDFKDTTYLFIGLSDLAVPLIDLGKFEDADKVLREALALAKPVDSVEQLIDICHSTTDMFMKEHKLDSALKYNQLCFYYLSKWKHKEADSEADTYRMQGALFSLQKDFNGAEKSYAKAVELMGESDEGRRRESGKIYAEFGAMFLAQNKEQQALQKFQHALNCFIPEFNNYDAEVTPDSSMLYDENGLFEACRGKGNANMKLFYKTNDKKYLTDAALNYRAAKIVLDKRDRGMTNESSRINFNYEVKDIIQRSNTVDSLLRIHSTNQTNP